ncbi:MAG: hypothetical protein GYB31_03655 [Bacteroidetes bacterium]|nr:hypothetical protein [Bacteroidota bacterium]
MSFKHFSVFLIAFFVLAVMPQAEAQLAKMKMTIFQDGIPVRAERGVYKLKKKPFSIRLRLKNIEGVYLNTSTVASYYSLGKKQEVPDLEFIQFQAYAEYEGNVKKLLYIDPEGFSYLFYDPQEGNRFNVVEEKRNGFEGYRVVQNFHLLDKDEVIPVAEIEYDLYLFFIGTTGYDAQPPNEELFRKKYQIKWVD